jgi:hypothetical protein
VALCGGEVLELLFGHTAMRREEGNSTYDIYMQCGF